MSSSELWFCGLIGLFIAERLVELVLSQRNARLAKAAGGVEVGREHYPAMVGLHTGLLVAAPLEVLLLDRLFRPGLGFLCVGLLVAAQGLRYWAIATLGSSWNTRVIVVPGVPARVGGPYRYLRHPNYLAVVIEVAALPLVHGAWITALVGSVGNALVLRQRIRVEEDALVRHAGYDQHFAALPRLLPGKTVGVRR